MRQINTSKKQSLERGNSQNTAGILVQINSNGPSLEPLRLPLRMWTTSYPGRGYMTTIPLPRTPQPRLDLDGIIPCHSVGGKDWSFDLMKKNKDSLARNHSFVNCSGG